MMEELSAALSQVETQTEISTILFRGNEQHFSAGVDVAAHTPDKVREMLVKFHAVIRSIVSAKKVTIAAVHGNCMGGGAELANTLLTDYAGGVKKVISFRNHGKIDIGLAAMTATMPEFMSFRDTREKNFFLAQAGMMTAVTNLTDFGQISRARSPRRRKTKAA